MTNAIKEMMMMVQKNNRQKDTRTPTDELVIIVTNKIHTIKRSKKYQ